MVITKAGSNGGVTIEGTPAKENVISLYTENISIVLKLILPKYDNLADAPAEEGSTIWITGAGADPEGAYRYDGADWKGLGAGSLTDSDLDSIVGFDLGAHVDRHTPETAADPISALTQAQMEGTEPPAQLSAYPLVHGTDTDVPSDAHHTKTEQRVDASIPQLIEDTSANIPAAGTEGRIFFESDTGKVKYDDGAAWNIIGTTNILDTNHTASDHEVGGSLEISEVNRLEKSQSGTVTAGDFSVLTVNNLADGETLSIQQAMLLMSDGTAVPSGVDLVIASLANDGTGTSQVTVLSGDGSTIYDDEVGSPLASWTNDTGAALTVAVGVDNGNWNVGSGADQDVVGTIVGVVS